MIIPGAAVQFEMGIGRYMFDMYGPKGFSESIRRSFLVNYADRVATAAQIESERPARCRIASYVTPEIRRPHRRIYAGTVDDVQTKCSGLHSSYIAGLTRDAAGTDK